MKPPATKRIDLDDLPPKVARLLEELSAGEEALVVRGAVVVGRLSLQAPAPPGAAAQPEFEQDMAEVMEQFRAAIEDEF